MANSFRKIRALYAENGSADSVMNCDGTAMMCVICPISSRTAGSAMAAALLSGVKPMARWFSIQKGFEYDLTSGDFDCNVTLVCDVNRIRLLIEYLFRIGSRFTPDHRKPAGAACPFCYCASASGESSRMT